MKTFALRIATLLLTAAASVSAGAVTVFDNLDATNGSWLIQHNSQYNTNLWVANRIPIGAESLRINQVTMDLDPIDQFELQVCATSASATTPFVDANACAPFTADAATPGRRVFTGNRVVAAGDFAWVVMRSIGQTKVRYQITNVTNNGLTWYAGASHNPNWVAEPQTSHGMRVNGASVQLDGVCGSASGTTPLRYPPEGASLCSVGTANGVWGEDDRFAWQCQGEYGGNPSQCSAPRAYLVTTQATGGGSIASGREVTAGQQASFSLTIPQGYTVQASGCGGALSGSTFTTGLITGDCTISANFTPPPTHGACGDTAPSLNWPTFLCSAGSPANQINNTSDAFRWNCAGTHGGTTAACQALRQYTVTVNKDEGIANAQCSPNPVTFGTATSCVATAHDPVGRPFSGWGGECSGTGSCMPLVFGPATVSAHSASTTYAISTSAVNGSVACSPNPVEHGQSASCTATPATGYHFTSWGGDCSGSGACQLNNVTGPHSVSATFALNSYAIATSGAYGTVQCTPNPVPHGQSAACTATANDNFHFTGWAGACTGAPTDGDCQLANVTGPLSVTGNFTLNVYVGILTPSLPGGILDCTPSPVLKGRNVTCTATPHTGYHFTGWTDDCAGTPADSACILTNVTKNGYVSGTFTLRTHLITTSADNGSVACTPNPVPFGEHAHCTPVPDAGYHFTGWAGACAGSGTCSLWYVTSPQNVSASFAINTYPITATAATGGSVDCAPNPVTHGQNAACTATPDAHYHFTGWTGDCTGTGACQLTNVTAPRSVSATFALNTYAIATPAAAGGSVACSPNPVSHGQSASCTATPDAGYHFTGWTGDCTGTGACQFTNVTSPRSVSATFAHDPVDASCGSAANGAVAFKPSANLCATGTPGAVLSASGQYTWQCSGEYGGAAQQCSAPWQDAGGNGNLGAVEVDSANGWEISSAAFAATLPAPLPPHVRAVHAPLGLVLGRVAGNGDAQVTVRFTTPVPQGASYYKYGPSPDGLGCTGAACAQPHWYALPGAQFAPDGMSVTFTLTDGGVGDSDSVPHQITDPGVPVLLAPPAPQAPQAIPALGPWALALLSLLAAGLGAMRRRALL